MAQESQIQVQDPALLAAFKEALKESNASFGIADVLLLFGIQVVSLAAIVILALKFWPKKGAPQGENGETLNVSLSNRAHSIMLLEDEYHQPIILSMPRILNEFKNEVKNLAVGVQQLTNHNVDILREIRDDIKNKK